jgi:hypothetical protein
MAELMLCCPMTDRNFSTGIDIDEKSFQSLHPLIKSQLSCAPARIRVKRQRVHSWREPRRPAGRRSRPSLRWGSSDDCRSSRRPGKAPAAIRPLREVRPIPRYSAALRTFIKRGRASTVLGICGLRHRLYAGWLEAPLRRTTRRCLRLIRAHPQGGVQMPWLTSCTGSDIRTARSPRDHSGIRGALSGRQHCRLVPRARYAP